MPVAPRHLEHEERVRIAAAVRSGLHVTTLAKAAQIFREGASFTLMGTIRSPGGYFSSSITERRVAPTDTNLATDTIVQ